MALNLLEFEVLSKDPADSASARVWEDFLNALAVEPDFRERFRVEMAKLAQEISGEFLGELKK